MRDTAMPIFHKATSSKKSFIEVTNALASQLGQITGEQFRQIVESSKSADEYTLAIQSFIGPSGFTVFTEIDHGVWITRFFNPLMARLYVLGNPLFAKDMLIRNTGVGLYVPTRLYVYEDQQGITQLAYDQLRDFANQFNDPQLTAVAEMVDQKLDALISLVAG